MLDAIARALAPSMLLQYLYNLLGHHFPPHQDDGDAKGLAELIANLERSGSALTTSCGGGLSDLIVLPSQPQVIQRIGTLKGGKIEAPLLALIVPSVCTVRVQCTRAAKLAGGQLRALQPFQGVARAYGLPRSTHRDGAQSVVRSRGL